MPNASSAQGAEVLMPWRLFLRALAEEIDAMASPSERDDMLRQVGLRMGRRLRLTPVETLYQLEAEINDALAGLGWGRLTLSLDEAERQIVISHIGLPSFQPSTDPADAWLGALLEGLLESWMAQQPGGDPSLMARRISYAVDGVLSMRYGRG